MIGGYGSFNGALKLKDEFNFPVKIITFSFLGNFLIGSIAG